VTSFRWINGKGNLCAFVKGSREYLVTIGLTRSRELDGECTCPAARSYEGRCKHQLAALVMARLLVTGDSFGWYLKRGVALERLKKELLEEVGSARKPKTGGPEFVIQRGRSDELLLSVLVGGMVVSPFHPSLEGLSTLLNDAALPWRRAEVIRALLLEPELPGPVLVELEGERFIVRQRNPVRLIEELDLSASEDSVVVSRSCRALMDNDPGDWESLGDGLLFSCRIKRLGISERASGASSTPGRLTAVTSLLLTGDSHGLDDESEEVSLEEWNEAAFPYYGEDDEPAFHLRIDEEPEEVRPIESPSSAIVELRSRKDGRFEIRVLQSSRGMVLPVVNLLLEELEPLIQGTPVNTFRAKRRADALWSHLSRVALEADRDERERLRDDFVDSLDRERSGSTDSGAEWLVDFQARWIDESDRGPCLPLLASEEAPHWFVSPGAARQALGVVALALNVLEAELVPVGRELCLLAGAATLERGLPAFLAGVGAAGAEVMFEGDPMEEIDPEIHFDVEGEEHIDWFELKPEVRHRGDLIPQKHWEQMLKGMPVQMDDGTWRIMVPEKADALEMLKELYEESSGAPAEKPGRRRISRMRLFDWLSWREAGITCELPDSAEQLVRSLRSMDGLPELPLPDGFEAELRPYQKQGYDWLGFHYRHRLGACLADDMGLGKTVQTIALLAAVQQGKVRRIASREERRPIHLLVLPPTLLYNWESEIARFAPTLTVGTYAGTGRNLAKLDVDVVLTTYELARRDASALSKRKFDIVVFDEAQHVKNLQGSRAQAMREVFGRFKVCLTGTPLENHAGEFYAIMDLALPGLFGDSKAFQQKLKEGSADRLLQRSRPFLLRRTKEKILRELPEKVESDVSFDLSEEQKAYYVRAVAEVREEVMEAYDGKPAQRAGIVALAALTRLRQICISPGILDEKFEGSSPKIDHLVDKLSELREEGHAALVFSQFTRGLDVLQKALAAANCPWLRLDGSTPQPERRKLIANFQDESGPPIFLISRKTGGAGLNLTRASYVFHLDPWWNPAVEDQATDRAHRIGQKQTVFVQRLLMRYTVEEKMMLLKERKRKLFDQVLAGQTDRDAGGILSRDDFAFLLGS